MYKIYKNIVLIGMPGCGKTTIGRLLSKSLQMDFIDCDEYLERTNKCSIEEMFKKGEDYFRQKEIEAVLKLSEEGPYIIATGGGVIKYKKNMDALKSSGIIIFIDRDIRNIKADIDREIRPLLKQDPNMLYRLFEERYQKYFEYCDVRIENNGIIEYTVDAIIKVLREINYCK